MNTNALHALLILSISVPRTPWYDGILYSSITPLHISILTPPRYHPLNPSTPREREKRRCVHGEEGDVHGGEERRGHLLLYSSLHSLHPIPEILHSTIPSSGGCVLEVCISGGDEGGTEGGGVLLPSPLHASHPWHALSIPTTPTPSPISPLQEREKKGCTWRGDEGGT